MKKVGRIIGIAIICLLVLLTFMFLWKKSRPEVKMYDIVSPVTGTIENKTIATGKVEPRDEILIKPRYRVLFPKY